MDIKNYIVKNFVILICLILIVILLLERCNSPKPSIPQPIIKYDTQWVKKDSIVYSKPKIIKQIIHDTIPQEWEYVDEDYESLKMAYNAVVNHCTPTNIYSDTFNLSTYGKAIITDSVQYNELIGRSFNYSISVPTITKTIIIPEKKVSQLYIGGNIQGNKTNIINQINAGVLLKNKKDQIFGVLAGFDINGNINYGIQSYWKISLKKNK